MNILSAISSYWRRSIRRQLMVGFGMATLGLMLASGYVLYNQQRDTLYRESIERATLLASTLSRSSTSWVLANDVAGLQEIVSGLSGTVDLTRAFVLAPNGEVLASTRENEIGLVVSDPVSLGLLRSVPDKQILADQQNMIDVAVPVMAGARHVGWARVELTRDSVNANLRRLAGVWLGFVLIAILLVVLVAVMLARGFMRGVTHLASVADEVQHGNNEMRANVLRKDEVGVLGQHLNRMLDALEEQSALLRESEEQAKNALNELRYQKYALDQHSIVAMTDVSGRIIYANNKFCEISGYSQQELLGQDHRLLNSGTHPAEFFRDMYDTIESGKVWHGEICNRAKDGRLYWVMTTIVPYLDSHGNPAKYIAIRTDITERKKAEEEIHNLAFYDALTQLPNRRMLNDRLTQAMASSKRSGRYGALMFLDLDNFKPLNDTHGHGVGDLLLIEVARRITNCVREVDTVARFGGDEFVVMLSELDVDKAQSVAQAGIVAEKIRVTLAEPYLLKLRQNGDTKTVGHHCTSSIGVVLFINNSSSKEDILKWADLAMYQAKSDGRNRIRFYDAQH